MTQRMKKSFLMVMLAFLSANVWAQDTLRLDLNKALEIALSENPTIKIADKEIELQEYVRKETVGNLLPNVSASGAYNRSLIKSEIDLGNGQKFSFEPTNTFTGTASLSVPLFAPSVYSMLKMNEQQMRAAVESARGSKITLASEVKKAFYNILLAQQSLQVLKASEANVQQTVDQTNTLFSQGLASEYDLLTAQVQLSNLKPTIIQTENSIKIARQLLRMYLNLPSSLEVTAEGSLDDFKNDILMSNGMYSADISNNSDLAQLDIQKDILYSQFRLSRTSRMPTLAAFGTYQWMKRNKISLGATEGEEGVIRELWEMQTPAAIGLQLNVPIFAGLTKVNKERQIKKTIEQIGLQRDYMEQSVRLQANTAINNLVTAQAQMAAHEQTMTKAQKGYDISKTRYLAGMGTILELNSAELSLTQAKLNYSQAIYDYLSAEAEYKKILGTENI